MNPRHWTNIRLIFCREVRDQLRDRRTLFMIAVLPLLLYPLMGMSFMQVAQFLKKHPSKILLVVEKPLPEDPPLINGNHFVGMSQKTAALMNVEMRETELPSDEKAQLQATNLIDQGQYDAVVCFSSQFIDELEALSASPDSGDEGQATTYKSTSRNPQIYYNAAKENSRIAFERVSLALNRWRKEIVERNLAARAVPDQATMPFQVGVQDLAEPNGLNAAMWSKILPFVVLVWALTGAFYPAIDLCAGEKERGTLETLLSSPAERSEIVCGKLLTIMLFSMTTAILNLLCMVFTASFILGQFQGMTPAFAIAALGPPPIITYAWLLVALFPLSALFSALSLALATMARSTKEGQYYLMPLLLTMLP